MKVRTRIGAALRMVALAVLALVTLTAPTPAHALGGTLEMQLNSDGRIRGTCHVVLNAAYESNGATGDRATQFWVTMPDGQVVIGYCGNSYFSEPDHGNHAQPGEDDYAFTAEPAGTAGGLTAYSVTIHSENSRYVNNYGNYKATVEQVPGLFSRARQRVYIPWYVPHYGDILLTKESAAPELTGSDPAYSYEGAVYTVRNDDADRSSTGAYILVGADGTGRVRRWTDGASPSAADPGMPLPVGSYLVWEVIPSPGFGLDPEVYRVTVSAGSDAPVSSVEPVDGGECSLLKESASPQITDGNPCYSLAGAEYEVANGGGEVVATLVTKADGSTDPVSLAAGTYTIRETKASKGYLLDATTHTVTIASGDKKVVKVSEVPGSDPRLIKVHKRDAETGEAAPQGAGSLADAQFTISYYDGYYDSVDALPGAPAASWVVATDERGYAVLRDDYLVSGDELFLNEFGESTLPLGTVTIRETKAPAGYLLPGDALVDFEQVTLDDHSELVVRSLLDADPEDLAVDEQAVRGGLMVKKVNRRGSELAGAVFSITNGSDADVVVGGRSYAPGEEVMAIKSGTDGVAATGARDLPFGTYVVTEKEAPAGYEPDGDWSATASVEADGEVVDLSATPCVNRRVTTEASLEATKVMEGRDLEAGEFAFELYAVDGDGARTLVETATNDAGGKVTFSPIPFDMWDEGVHTYEIAEVVPEDPDEEVAYDEHAERVTVTVTSDGAHSVTATVEYSGEEGAQFVNELVPPVDMPVTGERGVGGGILGAAMALTSAVSLLLRMKA